MSRTATISRATNETDLTVELALDGSGNAVADTGIPFFDHMLQQLGKHAGFDLSVTCKGEFDRHPSLGSLPPGAPPTELALLLNDPEPA